MKSIYFQLILVWLFCGTQLLINDSKDSKIKALTERVQQLEQTK